MELTRKGNPYQIQILYKMWKGTKWTRKSQAKADASRRGGKAQNRSGKAIQIRCK